MILQNWTKVNGEPIVDIINYIKEQLSDERGVHLAIGTDSKFKPISSKRRGRIVTYLTTIVFHKGNNGCHVIFRRQNSEVHKGFIPTVVKLHGEIALTSELVLELLKENIKPCVHLDLNPNKKNGSHTVYNQIHGYFECLGLKVEYKPMAASASNAADHYL